DRRIEFEQPVPHPRRISALLQEEPMTRNSRIARAVHRALVTSAVAAASLSTLPVSAQDQDADVQTVTVTGTRILKRDAIAESPLLTVGQEEMINSGYVTVDHYLNTLPQVVPSVSSQSNNPSLNGRALIDLRGLGSTRNLVL